MTRQAVVLFAVSAVLLIGCGEGVIGSVMVGSISSQDDPMIQRTLEAIDLGKSEADRVLVLRIKEVLWEKGIEFDYRGVDTLMGYDSLNSADTPADATCPYVGSTGSTAQENTSCSALANKIEELVQSELDALKQSADTKVADQGDGNIAEYRKWFRNAVGSTGEITLSFLPDQLRGMGKCDLQRTAEQNAKEQGVEEGRKVYIEAINERLQQVGVEFTYPGTGGEKAQSSTRYCQETLRQPSLQAAESKIETLLQSKSLCSSESLRGATSAQREIYQQAVEEFRLGLLEGAKKEDQLAQQTLLNGGACIGSPLVLDLAGDGLAINASTTFDLLGTGTKVETSWISGDDALLVRDSDGNGEIDDNSELFGNSSTFANGFDKLASYDSNHDGRIDARDPIYAELRLWQDQDSNGRAAANELAPLATKGVKAIELGYTDDARSDSQGNQFRQAGRFLRTDGAAGSVVDVWFAYR